MPRPTPADIIAATRFVDGEYRLQVCPTYFANNRERLIRQMAVAEMQKRQAVAQAIANAPMMEAAE